MSPQAAAAEMAAFHAGASLSGIASNTRRASALDFLTLSKDEAREEEPQEDPDEDDDNSGEYIARLMALLGLSPPPRGGDDDDGLGGCDCSGGDGWKVVGVVGSKCDKEKRRVDGWIEHYCGDGGGCRDGEGPGDRSAIAFPSTVKEFLDRDRQRRRSRGRQSDWTSLCSVMAKAYFKCKLMACLLKVSKVMCC